jgi:hypothetical protein
MAFSAVSSSVESGPNNAHIIRTRAFENIAAPEVGIHKALRACERCVQLSARVAGLEHPVVVQDGGDELRQVHRQLYSTVGSGADAVRYGLQGLIIIISSTIGSSSSSSSN